MNARLSPLCALALLLAGPDPADAAKRFRKLHLEKYYWSEGANFGDLNNDGKPDAVSGPYWWEGPDFRRRHKLYPDKTTFKTTDDQGREITLPGFVGAFGKKNGYSVDNFFSFVHDFNGDGWNDVLTFGLPGTPAYLYINNHNGGDIWERHQVFDKVDNESPEFLDLTGDGRPEIVCNYNGQFGYAGPDSENPTAKWVFHPITQGGKWGRFTHGLGVGDVNGDGRNDVLFKHGWFEQPKDWDGKTPWKLHSFVFSPGGGAQMYAYDVNGDGLNDVITSLAAHGYGLAWYEQVRKDGKISFKTHAFMNIKENENRYGVKFSQLHAVRLEDMNGDGLKDIITGKTYWAHGPTKDPEPNQPAVVYWFELRRKGGKVDWVPHLIDDDSGIGRQIGIADVNADGRPDVINGNKKGTFVLLQTTTDAPDPAVKHPDFYDKDLSARQVLTRTGPPRAASKFVPPPTPMAKGGVLPKDANGKTLNLDFEKGTLEDWTATGKAWEKQPHKGPINQSRKYGKGRYALHQGDYWLGGYEFLEDKPTGTLTSVPFKVTHPYAAFRIGGGRHESTRVELVRADTGKVFFKASGRNSEAMSPEIVDLRAHAGKEIFIRVIDQHSGGWGHVNFDDFRFYPERPRFRGGPKLSARRINPEDAKLKPDVVAHAGLSAEEAVKAMTLPKGFSARVFAAEPDVRQPIAMCLDDRGRVWIAEAYGYPIRQPEGQGKDRILCFEDTDGDGRHDRRTVFMEKLNLVSGIEYGFGGLWVGAAPYLYFIPIKDGDHPRPAGKPEVILEGWAWQDTHETLNSFRWGPDGWLYGCHGVFTHSHVKRPDEPETKRQFINAGVFRLHPVTKQFEVFAEGTSNPWGIDFNGVGHAFIEACVIPHFWHVIQGARYQRQGGQHYAASLEEIARVAPDYWKQDFKAGRLKQPLHPYIYDDIKTHGDHLHYLGSRPHAGNNKSDAVGGGHAHAGLMIYQGDSWPAAFRGNKVFIGNIHGQRLNMDILERKGSGYVGRHGPDFLNFNDRWSQALNFRTDQNGSVFIIDWYDANQCHRREEGVHDRSNGRIYKVIYDNQGWTPVNYAAATDGQLIGLMSGTAEMPARHARRLLQERAAAGKLGDNVRDELRRHLGLSGKGTRYKMFKTTVGRLRLLWALHVTGGVSEADTLRLLNDRDEYVRSWCIQLACEGRNPSSALLSEFARMAKEDESALVRLYLASALQRIKVSKRRPILEGLLAREADAKDHNLPLMYWYAAEPVVGAGRLEAIQLLKQTRIPLLRQYITRRMTAGTQ